MERPNLRFSIVIFGTAVAYTVVNWIAPAFERSRDGLNLPLLLVCLVFMVILAFLLEDGNSNDRSHN